MDDTSEEHDRIQITEWPMFSQNEESESEDQILPAPKIKKFGIPKVKPSSSTLTCEQQTQPKRKELPCQRMPMIHHRKAEGGVIEGYLEPMAAVRVAKWWRKKRDLQAHLSYRMSGNAHTRLYHISRLKECQEFLEHEKMYLEKKLSTCCKTRLASFYAALASVEDWLDLNASALKNITKAVTLTESNAEFLWLKAKISRQQRVIEIQEQHMKSLKTESISFPPVGKVERISSKTWTAQDIKDHFVKKGIPVIIEDVVCEMTEEIWNMEYIQNRAGSITVPVKQHVPGSVEWARLEDSRSVTIADHIDRVSRNKTTDYLFDWSLPLHCPELAKEIKLPSYFSDNFLTKTEPGSLYHDSWPSLFIAPAGVTSELHVDAFASSFWMALFQGQKRWTFFEASDFALLYPKYVHSLDPVFHVNIANPDLKSHPLLALTQPKQCVLKPGDLLFVPAGSPHYVENLTASLAISSNYVDATNFDKVCDELHANGLIDHRAKQLLEQFQSLDFKRKHLPAKT